MVELLNDNNNNIDFDSYDLLHSNEIIVIVDDSPEIGLLLSSYLRRQNLEFRLCTHASGLYHLLDNFNVAAVLLDIGLPDEDGTDVLKKIAPKHPDLGIIMVTGTTDIQVALECLREGADDYLTKPVGIHKFQHTLQQTLKKRRMAIDNRLFQQQLEETNFRTQFLHHLNLKMNSAYLSTVELAGLLQAILVGITSKEGLKFNRAFLALFDEDHQILHGRLAIGPARKEDANKLWNEIESKNISLQNIIDQIIDGEIIQDFEINNLIKNLEISITSNDHVLIRSCNSRNSVIVKDGRAYEKEVSPELLQLLGESNFVITPLYSPSKSLGVIIADNFVTGKEITAEDLHSLEIFASQASLAIEHSQLYREMSTKINELELATQEVERSKDLLIQADRLATLGHMSAQVVHAIRNPITALGGTARLLAKKNEDPSTRQFLQIIIKEASKVEATLEDLFNYVEKGKLHIGEQAVNILLRNSVMVFYSTMQKKNITCAIELDECNPIINVDSQKIRQVFHHLIRNSIEAMEGGGNLLVQTSSKEDMVIVTIKDCGSGIDERNIDKAKDAFFTTKTYGTGMGLTLVEQILTLHDATFSLQQNLDSGMCATIYFKQ